MVRGPRVRRTDDFCFVCTGGGTVFECDVCPRVFHPECQGLAAVPPGRSRKTAGGYVEKPLIPT